MKKKKHKVKYESNVYQCEVCKIGVGISGTPKITCRCGRKMVKVDFKAKETPLKVPLSSK